MRVASDVCPRCNGAPVATAASLLASRSPRHTPHPARRLTNIRAAGTDEAIRLPPPRLFPLEEAVVYVAPDELVEVTPLIVRLRKRLLDPSERDKASRSMAKQMKAPLK